MRIDASGFAMAAALQRPAEPASARGAPTLSAALREAQPAPSAAAPGSAAVGVGEPRSTIVPDAITALQRGEAPSEPATVQASPANENGDIAEQAAGLAAATANPQARPAADRQPPPEPSEEEPEARAEEERAAEEDERGADNLTPEEEVRVRELQQRDAEVRRHEQAHATVGGPYAGAPRYDYERGPDERLYAVSGEVSIDTSPVPGDPQATIAKMQQVRRAALAPADPSPQDQRVAAEAQQSITQARAELRTLRAEERAEAAEEAEARRGAAEPAADPAERIELGPDAAARGEAPQTAAAVAQVPEAIDAAEITQRSASLSAPAELPGTEPAARALQAAQAFAESQRLALPPEPVRPGAFF
jgi:hypothetical protein